MLKEKEWLFSKNEEGKGEFIENISRLPCQTGEGIEDASPSFCSHGGKKATALGDKRVRGVVPLLIGRDHFGGKYIKELTIK
jgi:hypothetical protein